MRGLKNSRPIYENGLMLEDSQDRKQRRKDANRVKQIAVDQDKMLHHPYENNVISGRNNSAYKLTFQTT